METEIATWAERILFIVAGIGLGWATKIPYVSRMYERDIRSLQNAVQVALFESRVVEILLQHILTPEQRREYERRRRDYKRP